MEATKGIAVRQCTNLEEWDSLVKESRQGNVFCDHRLAPAFEAEFEPWIVTRGDNIKAGLPVYRQSDGRAVTMPFTYYQGLLLSAEVAAMPVHRGSNWLQTIVSALLAELAHHYPSLQLSLHPTLHDMRGFDWFNHHSPELGQCAIRPRYTALVDCFEIKDTDGLLRAGRKDRRQDYNRALASGLEVVEGDDVALLVALYVEMFAVQNIEVSETHRRALAALAGVALSDGLGDLFFVIDQKGDVQSAQLALYDTKSGHAVANASRSGRHGNGAPTLACVEFVERVRRRGLRWADFNGANSPDRADFKHSLSANPQLFFEIQWPA